MAETSDYGHKYYRVGAKLCQSRPSTSKPLTSKPSTSKPSTSKPLEVDDSPIRPSTEHSPFAEQVRMVRTYVNETSAMPRCPGWAMDMVDQYNNAARDLRLFSKGPTSIERELSHPAASKYLARIKWRLEQVESTFSMIQIVADTKRGDRFFAGYSSYDRKMASRLLEPNLTIYLKVIRIEIEEAKSKVEAAEEAEESIQEANTEPIEKARKNTRQLRR